MRRAGSLLVGRDSSEGLQLLVLERSASSRFLPGYLVFPGGAVEPEDEGLAERWFGDGAQSSRACAVRELVEEVGLGLTRSAMVDGLVPASASIEAVDAEPPSIAQLPQIAHWVAPEEVPVRFDALYFAARGGDGLEPKADGVEIADAFWISPTALLESWEAGLNKLYWPTYFTAREVRRCPDVEALLSLEIRTREPDDHELEYLHRSTFWQE
jgi:8-oxo-dGTP pyrophosphatase MutT (NUDIX family)